MRREALLLAGGLLVLLVPAVLVLHAVLRRQAARAARIEAVMQRHRPARATEVEAPLRLRLRLGRLDALLGIDRRAGQPAPWRRVALVLAMASGLCWLAQTPLGALVWLALPAMALAGLHLLAARAEAQRRAELYRQFPDALAMIVRAVRVGLPVTEALRVVAREALAPTNQEFTLLSDRVAIGQPLEEALSEMAREAGLSEYRFFATALVLQSQTGGSLNETLENLAEVIRRRVALRARAHALAAEARTSAIVLGCLPGVAGLALYLLSPDYIGLLFHDGTGHKVLMMAALLLACGVLVMRGIVRKSLQ